MTKNDQISQWAHGLVGSDSGKTEAADEEEAVELSPAKKPNKHWGQLAKAISEGKVAGTSGVVKTDLFRKRKGKFKKMVIF